MAHDHAKDGHGAAGAGSATVPELAPSTAQALEQLTRANAIYEPDEKNWQAQLLDVIIWAVEMVVVYWLAWVAVGAA